MGERACPEPRGGGRFEHRLSGEIRRTLGCVLLSLLHHERIGFASLLKTRRAVETAAFLSEAKTEGQGGGQQYTCRDTRGSAHLPVPCLRCSSALWPAEGSTRPAPGRPWPALPGHLRQCIWGPAGQVSGRQEVVRGPAPAAGSTGSPFLSLPVPVPGLYGGR